MSWSDALKEYAKQIGKFSVPKKGSPEYDAVVKIHNKMKGLPDPQEEKAKKSRKKKEPVVVVEEEEEGSPTPTKEEVEKALRIKTTKEKAEAKKKAISEDAIKKAKEEEARKAKEDKYAKLEAEVVALKKQIGNKGVVAPAVEKKLKEKKEKEDAVIKAAKEKEAARIAAHADKKAAKPKKDKPTFKLEDKPVVLSFSE